MRLRVSLCMFHTLSAYVLPPCWMKYLASIIRTFSICIARVDANHPFYSVLNLPILIAKLIVALSVARSCFHAAAVLPPHQLYLSLDLFAWTILPYHSALFSALVFSGFRAAITYASSQVYHHTLMALHTHLMILLCTHLSFPRLLLSLSLFPTCEPAR